MRKILLTLWVITFSTVCPVWAQVIFDPSKPEFFHSASGRKFTVINIPLLSTWTHRKPNIADTKILDADERAVVEFSLKENGRRLIFDKLKPVKNDYQHDFDRGTVYYTSLNRNYSFHKVIIPNGTVVRNSNFTQKNSDTIAIEGKNLTFIDCNLVNNAIDPSWILQGSNIAQIKRIKKSEILQVDGSIKIIISHQVKQKNGTYLEVAEDEEVTNDIDSYNLAILRLNK